MLAEFLRGASEAGAMVEEIIAEDVDLKYCKGCLRCNLLERCAIKGDDWAELSRKIMEADIIVFASPVYFHHLSASLKKILDRFRSFLHVQITESGLKHMPWHDWNKEFVLILSMGSSSDDDARPIVALFESIISMLPATEAMNFFRSSRLCGVAKMISA